MFRGTILLSLTISLFRQPLIDRLTLVIAGNYGPFGQSVVKLSFNGISICKFDDKNVKSRIELNPKFPLQIKQSKNTWWLQNKWEIILTLTLTVHLQTMWS